MNKHDGSSFSEDMLKHYEELAEENARLREVLELLRRYHWGDGHVTRENVSDALALITCKAPAKERKDGA